MDRHDVHAMHLLKGEQHRTGIEFGALFAKAPRLAKIREHLAADTEFDEEIQVSAVLVRVVELQDEWKIQAEHYVAFLKDMFLKVVFHDTPFAKFLQRKVMLPVIDVDDVDSAKGTATENGAKSFDDFIGKSFCLVQL